MTRQGTAGEAVVDERTDDADIVEDHAPDGEADSAETPDTWRGPSIGRWIAFAAIALGVLLVDQASKAWVTGTLDIGEGLELVGEWLRVVHWRNSGALFGLLPQSAPIFAVVSLGVVALIVLYHRRAGRGYLTTVALALLLGGAIGNLLDRLRFGSVVDFVDMGIGQWRFYTYNAADAAITTAILLLIAMAIVPRLADWGAGGSAGG
jgi:signal peptidase II